MVFSFWLAFDSDRQEVKKYIQSAHQIIQNGIPHPLQIELTKMMQLHFLNILFQDLCKKVKTYWQYKE